MSFFGNLNCRYGGGWHLRTVAVIQGVPKRLGYRSLVYPILSISFSYVATLTFSPVVLLSERNQTSFTELTHTLTSWVAALQVPTSPDKRLFHLRPTTHHLFNTSLGPIIADLSKSGYRHDSANLGISLAAVRRFLKDILEFNESKPVESRITKTVDAANILVKPQTVALSKGFASWANLLQPADVGVPTIFVSHTWQGDVVPMLTAIIEDAERHPLPTGSSPDFYYIDIVSVDQHVTDQVCWIHMCSLCLIYIVCKSSHQHS